MAPPLLVTFRAGMTGSWRIERTNAVIGEPMAPAEALDVTEGPVHGAIRGGHATWVLRGFTSNTRYAARVELDALKARQEGLGRGPATKAALIPIRKTAAWWDLAQDERRAIMEERSCHIAIGLDYIPAVARRLHHSRDIGEPFDFLTWFEFAPEHESAFETLLLKLRRTEEWSYVDREVDIRLARAVT